MKLRVAITGSSGYLAHQLITRLGADPGTEFILGLDIRRRETEVSCPAEFLEYDITRSWSQLASFFQSHGINTGLHLAWQFNPIHDSGRHRQVDVEGSLGFFRAAAETGLKRVVYTSSTTAYTDARNSENPLPEETQVTGTPRYLYSRHKGEVDRLAQKFARAHPEIQVLILRPCIVLGPHTRNVVSAMAEWPWPSFPWMLHVRGADPPMQFLSEEDIGEILFRSVKAELTGISNCAGDGAVRLSELAKILGKKTLSLPASLIYPFTELLWKLHLMPFPSGTLDMIRYPWLADNGRMRQVFGFRATHDLAAGAGSVCRGAQIQVVNRETHLLCFR